MKITIFEEKFAMFQSQKIYVEKILPINERGSTNDSFAYQEFDHSAQADFYFTYLKKRLLSISMWSKFAGGDNFIFELTDSQGNLKSSPPIITDKIRIQLPGPKDQEGLGFDWVEVVRMDEGHFKNVQFYLLEVSPCDCPYQNSEKTAHFYWENATNTFVIAKQENIVQISIHGRNELPNISDQNLIDKIRNFLVANAGIITGSKIQWEVFSDNLMKEENE